MKKSVAIILALAVILTGGISILSALFVVDNGGIHLAAKTSDCVITIGNSTKFTEKEIENACKAVKRKFRTFNDCNLLTIEYNEEESNAIVAEYVQSNHPIATSADNMIILTSSFEALSIQAGEGSLGVGIHSGWRWIITRDSNNGKWKVKDCGYA